MAEELLLLSPAQIEAAANVGRLARLAERLVEERSWSSVDMLLTHATLDVVPMEELAAAARAVDRALGRMPEAKSRRATVMREIATLRALAATSLAKRLRHDPLTAGERSLLALAAELLMAAGDPREAARLFERAGEDMRAADAHGASGDLEKMEACHERLESHRGEKREASSLARKVETLTQAGERRAALQLLQASPRVRLAASGLQATLDELGHQLCRARTLSFKLRGSTTEAVRYASFPALLGRDPHAEIVLRDPAVSRRHALLQKQGEDVTIEDVGSRTGTTVGGLRLAGKASLMPGVQIGLGNSCRIGIESLMAGCIELRGLAGLDRAQRAIVGTSPLHLGAAFPFAQGLMLHLNADGARIERLASTPLRVAGHLVGLHCDLLFGDVLEFLDDEMRIAAVLEVRP